MKISVTDDLAACHALRRQVFIDEQGVPEAEEIDDLDAGAIHLLAHDGTRAIGTARLLLHGTVGKIGRVCVSADCRGTGAGAAQVRAAVAELRRVPGLRQVTLGSQVHAMGFYEKLGFRAVGQDYLDAGIVHRDMVLDL